MRNLLPSICALGIWSAAVLPASAGWDNVFQPTLFNRQRTQTNYYAPPAVVYSSPIVAAPVVAQASPIYVAQSPPANPCNQCQTSYTLRSYYQPVTTMETRTVMEKVTSYRTSYYYEPVTTVRYSAYYDPCNCNYTQVAVPSVSYQLREQKCPVENWVSRCVQVPVQGYQKVNYWQPQTTCCNTTQGAPIPMTPGGGVPPQTQMPPVTSVPNITPDAPPAISGTKTPGTTSAPKTNMWDQFYPPINKVTPTPGTSWQPQLGAPVPMQQQPTNPPPPVKFDRIAVNGSSQVEGQVVGNNQSPKANAKVMFVNASTGQRLNVNANTAGRFNVDLQPGSWHVYLHGNDDVPVHHSRIDVNGQQNRQVQLVSRSN